MDKLQRNIEARAADLNANGSPLSYIIGDSRWNIGRWILRIDRRSVELRFDRVSDRKAALKFRDLAYEPFKLEQETASFRGLSWEYKQIASGNNSNPEGDF